MHMAKWWQPEEGKIRCSLCPRHCLIAPGKAGFCFVRANQEGELVSRAYGQPVALQVDPVEKKPLSHFLPGTAILSLGTAGCNLGCQFCQNWQLSNARQSHRQSREMAPEEVVALAQRSNCASIAYTYNDPTIWGEYVIDVARLARQQGLRNVMVTAGYINREPMQEIYADIDAANIDLKALSDDFYQKFSAARLQPVLDAISWLHDNTSVWIELTTLLIPGANDSDVEIHRMITWIKEQLGVDVPWHLTAFHPAHKLMDYPPTPAETLRKARQMAIEQGLRYVYTGNTHDPAGQTTFCPGCGQPVIERDWHSVGRTALVNGKCTHCQQEIAGVFDNLKRVKGTDEPDADPGQTSYDQPVR